MIERFRDFALSHNMTAKEEIWCEMLFMANVNLLKIMVAIGQWQIFSLKTFKNYGFLMSREGKMKKWSGFGGGRIRGTSSYRHHSKKGTKLQE